MFLVNGAVDIYRRQECQISLLPRQDKGMTTPGLSVCLEESQVLLFKTPDVC